MRSNTNRLTVHISHDMTCIRIKSSCNPITYYIAALVGLVLGVCFYLSVLKEIHAKTRTSQVKPSQTQANPNQANPNQANPNQANSNQAKVESSNPSLSATRFALFIGANMGFPNEPLLKFAEKDALHVSKVFSNFGQVPAQNQVVLLSPSLDEIAQSFQALKRRIQALSTPDQATLILYYSGHADANALHIGPDRLTFDQLKKYLKQTPAVLKLILIDACRSGAFTRLKGAKRVPALKIKTEPLVVKGVAVISSASPHEDAQESDMIQGGIFTQHLVTGLMGAADRSQDRKISLTEIYEYTYKETVKSTSQTPIIQHPNYAFNLRGKQDFILTKLRKNRGFPHLHLYPPIQGDAKSSHSKAQPHLKQTTRTHHQAKQIDSTKKTSISNNQAIASPNQAGVYLLIPTASDHPLTEIRVQQSQSLLIHPGRYLIRYRDASGLYEKPYTFKPNQSYNLKGHSFPQIPYGVSVRRGQDALSLSTQQQGVWALSLETHLFTPLDPSMSLRWGGALQTEYQFPSFSVHTRVGGQWSHSQMNAITQQHTFEQIEVFGEMGVGYFIDFRWLSLFTQIWGGAVWIQQRFAPQSNTFNRSSWGAVITPQMGIHGSLGARFFTRIMGGPRLWIVPKASSQDTKIEERIGWNVAWSIGAYL